MATLSSSLRSEQIVVLASLEDMRSFSDPRGGLTNQFRHGCRMTSCQVNGAHVDGEILELGSPSRFKLSICR